ncbi:MAG: NAD(P)/FAD-dependent oxidoreductase [Caldilineae bacterium]|nr:MAG: NAD(P)/FAD-dependent oxidoreductase [Caldilineae bacterium]
MSRRYLIVGAGAAGVAAAEAIRAADPAAELTILGEEKHPFYSRPGLAYYLTGELPERQLFLSQIRPFRHLRVPVTAIHPDAHRVTLSNGQTLSYDRLLIATGSQAIPLPLPGADLTGVVKLDTLDDARHILKLAKRDKPAVVIGGGITALEIVEGLLARGMQVHYLLRGDRYWRNVLDETESRLVEERLVEEGVQLHHRTQAAEFVGKRGRVTAVRTTDGRLFECRLVAVSVGVRPRMELAQAAGLHTERGILTNEYLQTSHPDIFAAGDVAQVFDPFSGATVLDTLWGTAVAQGRAAGRNMAGETAPYRKEVPLNVTRLAGLTTTIIGTVGRGPDEDLLGIARGDSETWRQLPDVIAAQSNFEVNRLRLLVGKKRLVGALVMGDQTLSQPLHHLIARRADITPIRDKLLAPNAPLADIIAAFWISWRKRHAPSPEL